MKVLLVNTYDIGGAAKAVVRLHNSLIENGINTFLLLRYKEKKIRNSFKIDNLKIEKNIFKRLIKKIKHTFLFDYYPKSEKYIHDKHESIKKFRHENLEIVSLPLSSIDITSNKHYIGADIIHLHWVSGFLDWTTFFSSNNKPIIWTLHDQNPFLGFNHYEERYLGINAEGYPYEREKSLLEINNSKYWLDFKRKLLSKSLNLTIVSPSKWLLEESKKNILFSNYRHLHIPNGFPTAIFKESNQIYSRNVLNLPIDKHIVLFVSSSLKNERKGFQYLLQAQKYFNSNSNILFCAIGENDTYDIKDNIKFLGMIHNDELMSIAYSAADVFIIPSLEDNLPNTMIESLLCGTPVIGFPTGGILDVIDDGFNGYLCEEISVTCLKEKINLFFNNINSFNRSSISKKAQSEFCSKKIATSYNLLYKEIIELL